MHYICSPRAYVHTYVHAYVPTPHLPCACVYRGHMDHVLCVQFKDNMLVSGSGDCTIIVWDLSTYEMKRTLRGHKAAVTTLQFDSSRIISGSLDRLIKIWDLGTWQVCVWGGG